MKTFFLGRMGEFNVRDSFPFFAQAIPQGQATLETHGKPSNTPKQVEVAITSNDVCFLENYQLTFISSDRTFCAKGEESSGPCLGLFPWFRNDSFQI